MDLSVPAQLTPLEALWGLVQFYGVLLAGVLAASAVRRVANGLVLKFLAYLILLPFAACWLFLGVSLAHPHRGLDVAWFGHGADPWNYFVELVIGLLAILGYLSLHFFVWRRWARRASNSVTP